jgi:caffeoyl-CoA O-methyltransferase
MSLIPSELSKYIENHTSPGGNVLDKIERETYLKSIYPRMLSGNMQGRFLSMISKMIRPDFILEIGTFTGYSAICLCEGLSLTGKLHTIEINEELKRQNAKSFAEAGLSDKIVTHYGPATEIIPKLGIMFDLIFIDADKINYSNYYNLSMSILRKDGFILADNVLWSGKVIQKNSAKIDKDAEAVNKFNDLVQHDKRVENVMIPLRDGMSLIQKIC